jgi:hypothetical protein
LPLLYIKGFAIYGKTGSKKTKKSKRLFSNYESSMPSGEKDESQSLKSNRQQVNSFNVAKCFLWLFIGIFWLLAAVCRDVKDFWAIIYAPKDKLDEEKERTKVQQVVNEKVIRDF